MTWLPSTRPFRYEMVRSPRSEIAIKAIAVARALQLGAASARVVSARCSPSTAAALSDSFARGDLATWNYDDAYAQRASAPEHLLAGARSVLCVALPYATPEPARDRLEGRVSNYAWSADYHARLYTLLREVAKSIDEAAGAAVTAVACDTKPLAERAFAAAAGLGWVGKHTNLIAPESGSFIFLGEIVTTLDLPADEPLRKTCGACRRCVDVCPTGALRGDYTIDATRCIADLTQRTDAIPRELRPLIGDWVWGCDLCQIACPPTQLAGPSDDRSAQPFSRRSAAPSLLSMLSLTSANFKRFYRPTAMGWRGAAVLRRNAAVALGNALDRSAVPALIEALQRDGNPMVRGHVAWALGRIGSPAAIAGLRRRLDAEVDSSVREELEAALEPFGGGGR